MTTMLLDTMRDLIYTCQQLPVDVRLGKIDVEEARECLRADKERNSKELNKFFRENKSRGVSPLHQQLWKTSVAAYKKCYSFLYDENNSG